MYIYLQVQIKLFLPDLIVIVVLLKYVISWGHMIYIKVTWSESTYDILHSDVCHMIDCVWHL